MSEELAPEEETHVTDVDAGEEVENEAIEASSSDESAELAEEVEESAASEDDPSTTDAKPERKRNRISAKDRIAQLTARVKELESTRPDPNDYAEGEASPEYRQREIDYAVEQALKQRDAQAYQKQVTDKFNASLHEAAEVHGEDTVADAFEYVGTRITPEIANAIKESGKGGDIVVHLANNADELAEIANMSPYAAAVRIGQLTAGLNKPAQQKTVSKAPPPPSRVGSNNTVSADIDDETLSVSEYEARFRKKHGSIHA